MSRDTRITAIEDRIRSAHFGIEEAYASMSGPGAFEVAVLVKPSADCEEVKAAIEALFAQGFEGWAAGLQSRITIRRKQA